MIAEMLADARNRDLYTDEMNKKAQTLSAENEIGEIDNKVLRACAVVFLSSKRSAFITDFNIISALTVSKDTCSLKEVFHNLLEDLVFSRLTFEEFRKINIGKKDGWIRSEWFERTKDQTRKLATNELCLLQIHICLAVRDRVDLAHLSNVWGITARSIYRKKKDLAELFCNLKAKCIQTVPLSPKQKAVGFQSVASPAPMKQHRQPPTPIFSPSTKPSSSKKARRKSCTPKKINSIFDQVTTNHQVIVDGDGTEAIESILTTTEPESYRDVAEDRNNKGDEDIYHIANGMEALNIETDAACATGGIRRVTPNEEEKETFSFTDNLDCDNTSSDDSDSDLDRLNTQPDHELWYDRPQRKSSPKRLLSSILSTEEYPLLTGGLKRTSDIRKVFEESARYLGFDAMVKAMFGTSDKATSFIVPKVGGGSTFVEVPTSSTTEQFATNARVRKWVDLLLKTAGKDLSEDETAAALMIYLTKRHPKALPLVGRACNIPSLTAVERMDPQTSAAMWHEANLAKRGQRVIKRYIYAYFGFWITSSEKNIDALTSHYVRPFHGKAMVDEEEISFWYRNVDEVVKNLLDNDWMDLEFDEIHVVFGGDHGQTVFGAAVKIMLLDSSGEVLKFAVEKVGHIDCKKDTYEVLEKTIAKPLNESLQRLKQSVVYIPQRVEGNTASGSHNDGDSISDEDEEDLQSVSFVAPGSIEGTGRAYTIKLLAVGDLAFVSTALGKKNMGGSWCYLCDLSPKQWKQIGHEPGEKMTLRKMEMIRQEVANDTTLSKPQISKKRKGCTDIPLFPVFEPCDWVIPCLHVMMGAMNDAFTAWLDFIDERHEHISPDEKQAREAYWDALNLLNDLNTEFEIWMEQRNPVNQELQETIEEYTEKKKQRNKDARSGVNKFTFSSEQRKRFGYAIREAKDLLNTFKKVEKPARLAKIKEQKSLVQEKKKNLETIRSRRGHTSSKIRQSIDRILKRWGVDRGASHGGDFTGVACLVLEDRIEEIMAEFKEVLLQDGNGDNEEIEEYCNSYRLHFLLLSHMFSLARTTKKEFKIPEKRATVISQLKTVIPLVNKSTERLGLSMETVKRHLFSEHLIEMVNAHGGIAEYLEDWVEQIHQRYKKSISRGKMRDLVMRANYQCQQDKVYHHEGISKVSDYVKNIRSRKLFAGKESISKAQKKSEERHSRRVLAVIEATGLFEAVPKLRSPLERNLMEMRERIAVEEAEAHVELEEIRS